MTPSLRQLAEEFRQLERLRRSRGLRLGEAPRHRALFAALSKALALPARETDQREFLRVSQPFTILFSSKDEVGIGVALDFGGGGLFLGGDFGLQPGQEVSLTQATLGKEVFPLGVTARVAWRSEPGHADGVGLVFQLADDEARERVDRVFWRAFELFLESGAESPVSDEEAS